jgi:hypothetical protein
MIQVNKQLGQVLVDFANAPSSDDACRKHFSHMQTFMSFSPAFATQAEKATPLLSPFEPLPENEEFFDLVRLEKGVKSEIEEQLEVVDLALAGINYENQYLLLAEAHFEREEYMLNGEPYKKVTFDQDLRVTYQDIQQFTINELEAAIGDEIGKALNYDFFERLHELMKIGKDLAKMKGCLADTRLLDDFFVEGYLDALHFRREIEAHQGSLRRLLEHIICGERLVDNRYFLFLLDRYNSSLKKSALVIKDDCLIAESLPICESDYFFRGYKKSRSDISLPREPQKTDAFFSAKRISDDIAYCLIEFIRNDGGSLALFRICSCKNFFVASKADHRFKRCPKCTGKSTMTKEQQRLYHRERRARIRAEKKHREQEQRIERIMNGGYTREESLEIIKTDSEM